jgi:hypothetical protein
MNSVNLNCKLASISEGDEQGDEVTLEKSGVNVSFADFASGATSALMQQQQNNVVSNSHLSNTLANFVNNSMTSSSINNNGNDFSRMQSIPFRLQSVPASAVPTTVQTTPVPNSSNNSQAHDNSLGLVQVHHSQPSIMANTNTQIILQPNPMEGQTHIDITSYLHLPQTEAAKKLGMPTSTLSKRWKEAVVNNRKWPYRAVTKLDKEIMTLLHNIPQVCITNV